MNKIKLIETVTRGSHIRKTVDPGLILGNEDNGYLMGDILDANATASLIESSQLQSDWNQTDDTEKDYIKNKPDLTSMFAAKQDAPSTAGTDGQIFSLNAQGKPTWINPAAGSVVDNSMSGISTNPVQNNVIKEYVDDTVNALGEEIDSRKANKDGYYEQMGVGLAKNLEGSKVTEESFFNRPTGGEDAELADGLAQLTEVKGKSVKWNQLVENGNFANGITRWSTIGITMSVSNNIASVSAANNGDNYAQNFVSMIIGHKYMFIGSCKSADVNSSVFYIYFGEPVNNAIGRAVTANVWETKKILFTCVSNTYNLIRLENTKGGTTNEYRNVMIFDLTALGIDNLTTVEEVEAWLAENLTPQEYYPYSEGAVVNVNMTGIESFKRNLLNPETGKAVIIGAYSEAYGNYYGICGTYGTLTFTDAYGNESTITPDADGKFELDVPGTLTVADAGADCAVFLWWDGTKTEFSEYGTSIAKLDIAHIYGKKNGEGSLVQVWPTGAPGLDDLQDILKVENGAVVAKRVVGEADLGSLTWDDMGNNVFYAYLDGKKLESSCVCSKYVSEMQSYGSEVTDKAITTYHANSYVYCKDTSYVNAVAFKTAMNGVMLYYELATPETYTDLVYQGSSLFEDGTPVTLPVNYEADNWGIERILPVNSSEGIVTAAPTVACKYSIDAIEQLDTHTTEISDLYDKTAELNATKANKSGEYPEMVVGAAAALKGDNVQTAEFVFRKTGAPDNVASGLAQIESVKGKSIVWNQIVQDGNVVKTVSLPTFGEAFYNLGDGITQIVGHKYYLSSVIETSSQSFVLSLEGKLDLGFTGTGSTNRYSGIGVSSSEAEQVYKGHIRIVNTDSITDFVINNVLVLDLTLMFGAGNEPTTAEEFEKMFPLDYYDYNIGTIINNKATGIEVVGFNQWDEEWENGAINPDTGVNVNSVNRVRAKNYTPVFPSTNYYISTGYANVLAFDANKNYLGRSESFFNKRTFTTGSDVRYLRFYLDDDYGTTYNNDICINISDPSKNGTYEPYKKSTVALNIPTLTGKLNGEGESVVICADGLRGVGTAFDEGVIENGYLTKVSKHIGKQVVSGSIGDTITLTGCDTNETIFLCASEIGTLSGGVLTLTADADNVSVYFKLAEPEVYVLDEPLPVTYQVDGDGTERRLPADTASEISAPFAALIRYSMDAVGTINNLPKDYDSTDGLDDLCSALATALGPAMNGTLSITRGAYNATTHKYAWTVTFTPNAPQELGE